jgi:hypothetical protein
MICELLTEEADSFVSCDSLISLRHPLNWKATLDSVIGAEPRLAQDVTAIWAESGSPTFPSFLTKMKVAETVFLETCFQVQILDGYLPHDTYSCVFRATIVLPADASLGKGSRQFIISCLYFDFPVKTDDRISKILPV